MVRATRPKWAFVTLLYSDFVVGTRNLGRSLQESGTAADMLVLVTPDVTERTKETLRREGWIVRPVEAERNPNAGFSARLVNVYTKLQIFGMTEYERIVFLDSDTLVLENVDELFACEPFCAVMRHSELLNSGVLVLTPSQALHEDMRTKFGVLASYTGGDQGFLNSYYPAFAACPLFEPYAPPPRQGLPPPTAAAAAAAAAVAGDLDLRCKRLPSRYNGDWPLLFVDGDIQAAQRLDGAPPEWVRRKRVRIMHFTFGAAKPWHWWTLPFLPYVEDWRRVYARLPTAESGKAASTDEPGGMAWLLAMPLVAVIVLILLWRLRGCRAPALLVHRRAVVPLVPSSATQFDSLGGTLANVAAGAGMLLLALAAGFWMVPAGRGVGSSWLAWALNALVLLAALEAAFLGAVYLKAVEGAAVAPSPASTASRQNGSPPHNIASGVSGSASASSTASTLLRHPLAESLASLAVLARLSWSLVLVGMNRGLEGLPLSGLVAAGIGKIVPLVLLLSLASTRLPLLWAARGAAVAAAAPRRRAGDGFGRPRSELLRSNC